MKIIDTLKYLSLLALLVFGLNILNNQVVISQEEGFGESSTTSAAAGGAASCKDHKSCSKCGYAGTCPDGSTKKLLIGGVLTDCCCPADCCGNGTIEAGEVCDDGNKINCDGCKADCSGPDDICGDGNVECGEVCDDGNTTDCDGCKGNCSREDNICGDIIVECGEECDGGPQCNPDCTKKLDPCLIVAAPACNGTCDGADAGKTCSPCGGGCKCVSCTDDDCGCNHDNCTADGKNCKSDCSGCTACEVDASGNCTGTCSISSAQSSECAFDDSGVCGCRLTCGNGTVDTGEQCDPPGTNCCDFFCNKHTCSEFGLKDPPCGSGEMPQADGEGYGCNCCLVTGGGVGPEGP